jgi:endogenous inhibitor of DNA gyrase (YacG/DUF329 family)
MKGNPEPSLSHRRIEVKCASCGKAKSINLFEHKKNKTGNFYCDRECLKVGHRINFSGSSNPFFGRKHSAETKVKICGENHWNHGNRTATKINGTCTNCGNIFQFTKRQSRDGVRSFCSRDCRYSYDKSTRRDMKCSWCGKDVIRRAGYDLDQTYCSRTCWGKVHGINQPKGDEAYWFGKKGKGTPNWKGGLSYEPYGVDFDRTIKVMVRNRDDYSCRMCGAKENGEKLHAHHIDYNKKNNTLFNLVSLCRKCHCKTNGNRAYWEIYFQTLLNGQEGATTIPSGSTPQANGGGSAEHPTMRVMI